MSFSIQLKRKSPPGLPSHFYLSPKFLSAFAENRCNPFHGLAVHPPPYNPPVVPGAIGRPRAQEDHYPDKDEFLLFAGAPLNTIPTPLAVFLLSSWLCRPETNRRSFPTLSPSPFPWSEKTAHPQPIQKPRGRKTVSANGEKQKKNACRFPALLLQRYCHYVFHGAWHTLVFGHQTPGTHNYGAWPLRTAVLP